MRTIRPHAQAVPLGYCNNGRHGGTLRKGARHTFISPAFGRHDSAALSCPNSVRFRGWEGLSARTAARLDSCVYPHPHPYRLDSGACGSSLLVQEARNHDERHSKRCDRSRLRSPYPDVPPPPGASSRLEGREAPRAARSRLRDTRRRSPAARSSARSLFGSLILSPRSMFG